jgi:hypothetical protein
VVVWQTPSCELESLQWLHCVCVVIAEDPDAVLVVKRQAVSNAVKRMLGRRNLSRLDLDPEPTLLLQDAAVQIKKRVKADVATRHPLHTISSADNTCLRSGPTPVDGKTPYHPPSRHRANAGFRKNCPRVSSC